jgi:hypothetical protein
MADTSSPDVIDLHPEDYSVEELRAVLFGDSQRVPKVFALNLLRRKDYPEQVSDLERVILNPKEAPAIRHHAAIELGRVGSREALDALQRAAAVDDAAVRDTVTRQLAALPGARETAHPAVTAWQQKLDAVRRGVPEGRIPVPSPERLLTMESESVRDVSVEEVRGAEVERALQQAAQAMVAEATSEGALAFRAGPTRVLFLPNVSRRPTSIDEQLRAPAILGNVLMNHGQEVDRWEVGFHVVTQPSEGVDDAIDIFVFKPWGELTFFGRATISDSGTERELSFRVLSVDAPGAFPIDVAGRFSSRGVELDHVRVGTTSATVIPQARPR